MSMEHPTPDCEAQLAQAGKAFAKSDAYDAARIRYTVESAEYLLKLTGVLSDNNELVPHKDGVVTILELGCGTGLLTGAMIKALEGKMSHVRYIATDPLPSMAEVFRKHHPDVEFMACAAESIPLADNSVDALLAGSCCHWFATHQAYTEMYRVIRPAGKLGYITNLPTERDGPVWCKLVNELIWEASRKSGVPWHRDLRWRDALCASQLFQGYTEDFSLSAFQPVNIDGYVQCFASYGVVEAAKAEDREMLMSKLRRIFDEHFTQKGVEFTGVPYLTEISHCQTTKTV